MKKLLFGITSLTIGGAERVLIDLVNKLSDIYDITIFTIYSHGELEKQLSEKVKLKTLYNNQFSELTKFQKKFSIPLKVLLNKKGIYKKHIRDNYDIEIAFLEGPITRLFSVKNKNAEKIAWVHNDVSLVFGKGIKSKIKKYIDRKIYSKYSKLVFVSKDNLNNFNKLYKDMRNEYLQPMKRRVVYNYINKERILVKANEDCDICFDKNIVNFISVARLVPQKAIDRLIKIHTRLIKEGFIHNFYIIGDGPEKDKLSELIKQNNVGDTFKLLGKKENPYPYIKNVAYFCLLSEFEGYGMVIEEAKILDKYVVITDTAAREAVLDYKNSKILDNSEEGIYIGLKALMEKKNELEQKNKEKSDYDNSKIIEKVIKVLEE